MAYGMDIWQWLVTDLAVKGVLSLHEAGRLAASLEQRAEYDDEDEALEDLLWWEDNED